MPNKAYKVGYALERDTKIALEKDGFTVFRSAGSHSQADLIAITLHRWERSEDSFISFADVKLIQCKRHKNLMTSKEIKSFFDFAFNLGCSSWIAWRDKGIHLQEIRP